MKIYAVPIKGSWKQARDEIKLMWGKLSKDDLTAIAGRHEKLASLLQQRHGCEKVEAENKFDRFAQGLNPLNRRKQSTPS